jgi:hypothetical protein
MSTYCYFCWVLIRFVVFKTGDCDINLTAAATPAFDTEFAQELFRRAKAGNATLEQVEANKTGKRQKPLGNEERATVIAEDEREHDEKAGHDADNAFDGHEFSFLKAA